MPAARTCTAIDWAIVAGLLTVLVAAALTDPAVHARRRCLSRGNRCGGRYIISMAKLMAGLGVISLVWWFELVTIW